VTRDLRCRVDHEEQNSLYSNKVPKHTKACTDVKRRDDRGERRDSQYTALKRGGYSRLPTLAPAKRHVPQLPFMSGFNLNILLEPLRRPGLALSMSNITI
jgi:hypothetical protein